MKCGALLVDGRHLLYRASDAFRTLSTELDGEEIGVGGMYGFLTTLIRVHQKYSGKVWIAWEGRKSRSFRRALFPGYKDRGEMDPDMEQFITDMSAQELRLKAILRSIGVRQFKGVDCEADDVLARMAMEFCSDKVCVIYTGDSDLRQLVDGKRVFVAAPSFQGRGTDTVYTPELVKEKHGVNPDQIADWKAIGGDTSDKIPGLKGIGAKTAAALLVQYGTLKGVIRAAESDDKAWPVRQAFKGVVAAGKSDLKLYRMLTGLRVDAECKEIERKRSKELVLASFAAYRFRSLMSPSDMHSIMMLGGG